MLLIIGKCRSKFACITIVSQPSNFCRKFKMLSRFVFLLFSIFATGHSNLPKWKVETEETHFKSPSILHSQSFFEYTLPHSQDMCQVKLDFLQFNTDQGPQAFLGDCSTDTLKFVGATNTENMGPLCGNLTGQHLYLNYMPDESMSIQMYISSVVSQEWDILATEIQCGSAVAAPAGCLQYFTEPSGTVISFNWNNRQQLNLQNYRVCIKSPEDHSSITWSKGCGFNSFFISGMQAVQSPDLEIYPDITNAMQGISCKGDYVLFTGVDKMCGNYLNGSVTSTFQPFTLEVYMNSYELPLPGQENGAEVDDQNFGFCLSYVMN